MNDGKTCIRTEEVLGLPGAKVLAILGYDPAKWRIEQVELNTIDDRVFFQVRERLFRDEGQPLIRARAITSDMQIPSAPRAESI